MKKLLFIAHDFSKQLNGADIRSAGVYAMLAQSFKIDFLALKEKSKGKEQLENYIEYRSGSWFKAHSQFSFEKKQQQKFKKFLKDKQYEVIFIRFLAASKLADLAYKVLPKAKIVMDVDMLSSRIVKQSWQIQKSIKNRFSFFEGIKAVRFERKVMRKPYLFLFSNPYEKALVLKQNGYHPYNFQILANSFKPLKRAYEDTKKNEYILFFGNFYSLANVVSFKDFIKHTYPLLEEFLEKRNLKIMIAGQNAFKLRFHLSDREQVNLVLKDNIEDIYEVINQALFCILPIKVGSGTCTRILQAATLKKAVITTQLALEGLDLTENELVVAKDARIFAQEIMRLVGNRDRQKVLGQNLNKKTQELYNTELVGRKLIESITKFQRAPKKILLLVNRFYPETGGAEINTFYQAVELAKTCRVTVMSPQRSIAVKREDMVGIRIQRYWNMYNPWNVFPYMKAKALCPGMLRVLFKAKYDVVFVFPALSYHAILAAIIVKLRKKKIVLCSFDALDYVSAFYKKNNNPYGLLAKYQPSGWRRMVLQRLDHILVISEHEKKFYQRFNQKVNLVPVPVWQAEYEKQALDVRTKYGLKRNDFVFLCLGRWAKIKGQDLAIKAFNQIKKEGMKMVLVGREDIEKEYYEEVKKYMVDHQLEEYLVITGVVERNEVLSWLKAAEISVVPVRFMNAGAIIYESWMCQTPVIQSDAVDPNKIIEDENGFLFRSEDIGMLAEKMRKAYAQRAYLAKMGQKGKELVLKGYTYEVLMKKYLDVLKEWEK
jgi:glycosyltransferase involved in cell wall biosynthesis